MELLLLASDKHHPDDVQPNIVVPFTNDVSEPLVHKAVKLNLAMAGYKPRFERLNDTIASDYAYDRLLRRLWAEGEPFILVEHDILPWPGALLEMWECERAWCAFPYYIFGEMRTQLGCTKFDPAKLGACPLPDEPIHWSRLDWAVITGLIERETGHLHGPAVTHLNAAHQRMTTSMVLRSG